MNRHSIFVFTNNDSLKLSKILTELSNLKELYNIHVIDDSSSTKEIEENIKISSKLSKNTYLGKGAFIDFYNRTFIAGKFPDDCIGTDDWNLGTARNFALDYSIKENYEKVLFIDDDISGIEVNVLDKGFKTLTENNFVSCNLGGIPDDSIVGHIDSKLNSIMQEPRMLSGGFLFLSPKSINHRFFNIYNEDWILQLMEHSKERIVLPFTVYHNIEGYSLKNSNIYFQEIGEIIVEALLINKEAFNLDYNFWTNVIDIRLTYIKELILKIEGNGQPNEFCILNDLTLWLKQLTSETLLNIINKKKK